MKILHLIDSGGMYGAETMLLHLMSEQKNLRLNPVLASIGLPNEPEKPIETQAKKIGITVCPFRMQPGPNWRGAWKILQYARKIDITILHSHGYKTNILFGLMPPLIRRIPMVTTLHGWTSSSNQNFCRIQLYEKLDAFSLRFIDSVVLVNQKMKDNVQIRHLNSSKLKVIENGIPIREHHFSQPPPPEIQLFLSQSSFRFIAVGRLSPEKGFSYLIEAINHLVKKGIDCRLVIFGEGNERSSLEEKITKLSLNANVFLAGFTSDVSRFFSNFNFFILSSLTEGLPMVLLEALSANIPVIATSVGGIPELLAYGKGGILVEPGDPIALGNALELVINEPQNIALNRAMWAKNFVQKNYSSVTMAKSYLHLYNNLHHIF